MSADISGQATRAVCLSGQRILVIEDEYFIAEEIRALLMDAGSQVIGPAPDIASGLALLAAHIVDCAVLDIDLAGEDVFPLAVALRAKNVPWVYVTGYAAKPVPIGLNGSAYIEKPLNRATFIGALERLR